MHCDVHYYLVKFEIKVQLMYGETKKENLYMGVKWTKLYSLGVKLNQVIIYGLFRLWLYLKGVN